MSKVTFKLLAALSFLIMVIGCQDKETLTDPISTQKPDITFASNNLPPNHIVFEFKSDTMQRDFSFPQHVVIDPTFYKSNQIQRGDIVYVELPDDMLRKNNRQLESPEILRLERKQLFRVVGLPGEEVHIRKGQVYINDRKLDTFYGQEYIGGVLLEKNKAFSMEKPIVVPDNEYFLLTDQWSRSAYSSIRTTTFEKSLIQGKVVGYTKE